MDFEGMRVQYYLDSKWHDETAMGVEAMRELMGRIEKAGGYIAVAVPVKQEAIHENDS